jgi:hypothetical protein
MNAAALDQFRDRIVVVVQIEALADAQFAAAERRMLSIADGKPPGSDDGLATLQRDLADAFRRSYVDVRRSLPDQNLDEAPPIAFDDSHLIVSLPAACEQRDVLPAIARAAATCHPEARVSITRTWEAKFPNLGGHEHAVESADKGFEALEELGDLARELSNAADDARRDERMALAKELTSLYATRIDGDGDWVTLHRLEDGAQVSQSALEERARQLLT